MAKKYFYEQSKFSEYKSNTTYHQLLGYTDDEFNDWARLIRKEIVDAWDIDGQPPVKGKDEAGIISHLGKLKKDECNFFVEDPDDDESLGILKNFIFGWLWVLLLSFWLFLFLEFFKKC